MRVNGAYESRRGGERVGGWVVAEAARSMEKTEMSTCHDTRCLSNYPECRRNLSHGVPSIKTWNLYERKEMEKPAEPGE